MNNNVSVSAIKQAAQDLETEFMKPLERISEELIDTYKELNSSLQSETINSEIQKVQQKFSELKEEFRSICAKASAGMDESAAKIEQEQNIINQSF